MDRAQLDGCVSFRKLRCPAESAAMSTAKHACPNPVGTDDVTRGSAVMPLRRNHDRRPALNRADRRHEDS
jgi:hypothetical protein